MNPNQIPTEPVVLKSDNSGGSSGMKFPTSTLKIVISFIVIILIIAGIGVGVYLARNRTQTSSKASGANATLAFNPAQITAKFGQAFTTNIIINSPDLTISGAEIHITYDAQILNLESFEKGPFLESAVGQPDIKSGTASLIIIANPANAKKGTGQIATLKFKPLQATPIDSEIIIDSNKTQISSQEQTSNVLGNTQKAIVKVTEATRSAAASPAATDVQASTPPLDLDQSEATTSTINRDFNGDGKVNSIDLSVLYSAWGTASTDLQKKSDLNRDDRINGIDYSLFLQQFKP